MIYFAWYRNHTDMRDDECIKIRASSLKEAEQVARDYLNSRRFLISYICTREQFKAREPWWHAHYWGMKAAND